jgi:hypothetical protein
MDYSAQRFFSFEGRWTFIRSVNASEIMRGTAVFHPIDKRSSSYSYQEEGTYIAEHLAELSFFREYIYFLENETIDIYFAFQKKKREFFHTLAFTTPDQACGIHHCACDIYKATYTFLKNDTFIVQYDVKGPKKDFVIQTVFKNHQPI